MKKNKIIFWITTIIFVLWDGVMPGLTSHTPLAVEAIRKLGYPDYFRVMLTVFKVIGAIILAVPAVRGTLERPGHPASPDQFPRCRYSGLT